MRRARMRPLAWAAAWVGLSLLLLGHGQPAHAQLLYSNGTPGNWSYTVPAGVTSLRVAVAGGGGGAGGTANLAKISGQGGSGALVTAVIKVNPGDVLTGVIASGGKRGANGPNAHSDSCSGTLVAAAGGTGAAAGGAGGLQGCAEEYFSSAFGPVFSASYAGGNGGGGGGATSLLVRGTAAILAAGGGGAPGGCDNHNPSALGVNISATEVYRLSVGGQGGNGSGVGRGGCGGGGGGGGSAAPSVGGTGGRNAFDLQKIDATAGASGWSFLSTNTSVVATGRLGRPISSNGGSESDGGNGYVLIGDGAKVFWDADGFQTGFGGIVFGDGAIAGGSGTWTQSATNWTDWAGDYNGSWPLWTGANVGSSAKTAYFQGEAGTVTIGAGESPQVAGLVFNTSGYVIKGGAGSQIYLGGAPTVTVAQNTEATIEVPLVSASGSAGLTKIGRGTLRLSGANTYIGATTVSGGTLLVNGSIASTDEFVVRQTEFGPGGTRAILGGTGTVGGFVNVGKPIVTVVPIPGGFETRTTIAAGDISPGDGGPGDLKLARGMTTAEAGFTVYFRWELAQAGTSGGSCNDRLTVTGNVNLASSSGTQFVITPADGAPGCSSRFGPGTYTLITATGTITIDSKTSVSLPAGYRGTLRVDSSSSPRRLLLDVTATAHWDGSDTAADNAVDGGSGTWSAAGTNWTDQNGSVNGQWPGGGNTANFGGPSGGTVTLGTSYAAPVGGLNFSTSGYTIAPGSGGTLALTQTATVAVGSGSQTGHTATISAPITGTGFGLTKTGAGTLTLSGANTYTGATSVNAGTLLVNGSTSSDSVVFLNNGGTLGGIGTIGGTVYLGDGLQGNMILAPGDGGPGHLKLSSGLAVRSLKNSVTVQWQLAQAATSGGSCNDLLTVTGDAGLIYSSFVITAADGATGCSSKFGPGTYTLLTATGEINITGSTVSLPPGYRGTLRVDSSSSPNRLLLDVSAFTDWDGANTTPNTIEGGTGTWSAAGTNWTDQNGSVNGQWPGGTNTANFGGPSGGTVTLGTSYAAPVGGLNFSTSGYTIAPGSGGTLALTQTATVAVGSGSQTGHTATISAPITGTGFGLTKTGAGTLTLSGANTYSGTTTVSAGTLTLGSGGSTSATAPIVVDTGATFNLGRGDIWGNHTSSGHQALTVNGGTLTNSSSSFNTLTDLTLGGGGKLLTNTGGSANYPAFALKGTVTSSGGASIEPVANASNTHVLIGSNTAGGSTTFAVSSDTLAVSAALANNRENSGISPVASNLIKTGTGTLTLSGANTYTGTTTVSAGTLLVNGSTSSSSAVTVNNGATLGGTGTVGGSVTVASGGTLSPGEGGPGTLTVGGALTLSTGSSSTWQLGKPGVTVSDACNDLVTLSTANTNVALGGSLTVAAASSCGGGVLAAGEYTLITYTGTASGAFSSISLPSGYTGVISLDTNSNPKRVVLTVSGPTHWDGANTTQNGGVDGGAGTWSAAGTNWTNSGGTVNTSWPGGLNTANFGGTAGTVTLDTSYAAPVGGLNFSTSGYTIAPGSGGTLALTQTATVAVGSGSQTAHTATISAPITGTGFGLTKTGAGTLTLSGANTYSGTTTVSTGTLQIGAGSTTGDIGSTAKVTVSTGATLVFNRSDDLSFGKVIEGAGALTQAGSGILTLSGANTYTGATTVSTGTLRVTGSTATNSAVTVASGATLGGTGTVGGPVTINGTSSSAGKLSPGAANPGTLTLAGNVSWDSNAETVLRLAQAGTDGGSCNDLLTLSSTSASHAIKGKLTITATTGASGCTSSFGAGTYTLATSSSATAPTVALSSITLPSGFAGAVRVVSASSNSHKVVLYVQSTSDRAEHWDGTGTTGNTEINGGTGTWNASSTNWTTSNGGFNSIWLDGGTANFGGTTTETAPVVTLANGYAASVGGLSFGKSGYTLQPEASGAKDGSLALSQNATVTVGSAGTDVATINVPITGSFALTKAGAGTLTLGAANTYSGTTTVSAGALKLTGSLGSLSSGVYTYSAAMALSSGTTLESASSSNTQTLSGVISGAGALTQSGGGTLILTGSNTYSGITTVTGGTLQVGSGGTAGSIENTNRVTLGSNGTVAFNRSDSQSFAKLIQGTGKLSKLGTNTLTLTANNTYTGTTTVSAGTLTLGATNANTLATGTAVTVASGATLNLNGKTQTFTGALTVSGTLALGTNGALTLSAPSGSSVTHSVAAITGSGTITVNAGATLELTAAVSNTSVNIVLAGGTLKLAGGSTALAYSLGTLSITASSTLQMPTATGANKASLTLAELTPGSSTELTVADWSSADRRVFATAVTGTPGRNQTNLSPLNRVKLAGNTASSTYWASTSNELLAGAFNISDVATAHWDPTAGNTDIDGGTGTWSEGGSTWATDPFTVNSFWPGGTTTASFGGTTTETAPVVTLANGYAASVGGLSFGKSDYTLQPETSGNKDGSLALSQDATVTVVSASTDVATINVPITGSYALTKAGAGTLTLGAANSYSGTTTVSAGTLDLSGSGGIYTNAAKSGTGSLTIGSGGVLVGDRWGSGSSTSLGQLAFASGTIAVNGGTLRSKAADDVAFGNRGISVGAGGITYENATSGKLFTVTGVGGGSSNANTYANNAPVTLAGAGNGSLGQVVSGTGVSLTKAGTGTWTLTASNTYTGATTVSAGTLLVTGSTAAGSAVTVSSGATLGGTGTVGGKVSVSGGTIAPGVGGAGKLTTGALTLNSSATLVLDLAAPGTSDGSVNDVLHVTGDLKLAGATLTINKLANFSTTGRYTLVTYTGSRIGSTEAEKTFGSDNLSAIGYLGIIEYDDVNKQVNLVSLPRVRISQISQGGVGRFDFTLTGLDAGETSLTTTTAGQAVNSGVFSGTIGAAATLSQRAPTGWPQVPASVSCVDANGSINGNGAGNLASVSGGTVTLSSTVMKAGAEITCTFTNTRNAISGVVFNDGGAPSAGSNTGTPNDGRRNGAEAGLSGVTVALTNCNGTVHASTVTDGEGAYALNIPSGQSGTVCVSVTLPTLYQATGASAVGSSGTTALPAGTATTVDGTALTYQWVAGSPAVHQVSFAAPTQGALVLHFGQVPVSSFTGDTVRSALAGMPAEHAQRFKAGTGGALSVSALAGTASPSSAASGWSASVYLDADCSGRYQANATLLSAAGYSMTVTQGQEVCMVTRVLAPGTALSGHSYSAPIQAEIRLSNSTLTASYTVTSRTQVGSTSVQLKKEVRNVTAGHSTWSENNQGKRGDELEYRITFTNMGASPVTDLEVHDHTGAWTSFVSATSEATPAGMSCKLLTPANGARADCSPAVTGTGKGGVSWYFTGPLQPQASGSVIYRVRID